MIKIDNEWNFEVDDLAWKELISKTFNNFSTKNNKNDFKYNLDQVWPKKSILDNIAKSKKTSLAVISEETSLKEFKELNIHKVLKSKQLKSYHVNADHYNQMGLDGRWELVVACHDLIELWKKNKIPKTINVLLSVDQDTFFQMVKVNAFQLVLTNLMKVFRINSDIKIDLIISDKIFTNTDPKSNLVRLTYALLTCLVVAPNQIILRPLPGITGNDAWKMPVKAYHILDLETDLTTKKNVFEGAPFFEKSVSEFSESIWEGVQYLFKMPDIKKRKIFIQDMLSNRINDINKKLFQREIKIVGVNEFVSPAATIAKAEGNGYASEIENKRNQISKKLKFIFKNVGFNFVGEQNKLSQKLNEIYQVFALLGISATWNLINLDTANNLNKNSTVIVLTSDEQVQKVLNNWDESKNILVIFENDRVHLKYKNKIHSLLYDKNPFTFLENLIQVVA